MVAAIQMNCIPGLIQKSLDHAEEFMKKQAVEKDAELISLPELKPSGYMATEEIWNSAETIHDDSVE